jgi:putative transposase
MQLVEQPIIGRENAHWAAIDQAAFFSKNIYNAANFRLRQSYSRQGRYIPYTELDKQFKQPDLLRDQQVPCKVVQQVLRPLDSDWQTFFAARSAWKEHPEQFTGRPRLPRYKHKTDGRHLLVYVENAYFKRALNKGQVKLSGLGVVAKTRQRAIDCVRIVPHKTPYTVEVVYTVQEQPDKALVAAGDLGLDTLVALTSNQPGCVPLLVSGRILKSINQGYNQHCAVLQSRLPAGQPTSRQLEAITDNRNRRIKTELHRCSKLIIQTLLDNHIGTLLLGKNDGWKQAVNLGKRTNQNVVNMPHAHFIDLLTYKARLVGITGLVTQECYTSQCSFLDLEPIGKHNQYLGKRLKRGLFQASAGQSIQADVNASYNLLRKVVPNPFADGIEAAVGRPVRVYPRPT